MLLSFLLFSVPCHACKWNHAWNECLLFKNYYNYNDAVAERIGVVADSETSRITLKTGDKYLIVATDGIWEFISSHEAATMVAKYQNPMEAAEALAAEAYRLWLQYERRTDDISIAIVSFEG